MRSPDPIVSQETAEVGHPSGPTSEAAASEGPRQIGKYEIRAQLGRGGMGAVYRAFDPILERDVALKVMLPQIAGDPEQKLRFEREARAVARLTHPSVVTVFDLGYHTDGSPYIVLELLKGRDLAATLKSGARLSVERKTEIILRVLDGLGLAHKRGIVHRDIKPPNIFITDDDGVKIMDFGIARFTTAAAGTGTGSVIGTAAYMSPEQVRGQAVDGRSDIFSTAIVLCELLSGRRPFDSGTTMSTMYKIANEEPTIELPREPRFDALLPILRRALAKDVADRFATATDFAGALRVFLGSAGSVQTGSREARADETIAVSAPRARGAAPPAAPTSSPQTARPDPSGIFALLREIYTGSKSGHLHFSVGQGRKSLRILKGRIIHGTSDVDGEHLGDILVRYGLLDQAGLQRAVAVVLRERRKLGVVLPELGILAREKIVEAVGLHVREILFSALDSPSVSFSFEELAESALEADLVCPLSTGEVILEATRRIQDPELVKRILGDMGRRLELSPDPLLRSQHISLTPTDGFVLSRIDGTLSAGEVVDLIPVAPEDTERSLFSLLCTGVVGYVAETTRSRRAGAHRTSGSPAAGPSTPSPPGGRDLRTPLPPRQAKALTPPSAQPANTPPPSAVPESQQLRKARSAEEIRSLILDLHAGVRRDHFEVLGLERSATEAEIREAYVGFARVLHPDACRDRTLADVREKRNAVFARLSEAYETLRDPESRARYEQAYEPSKLRTPFPPPAAAPPTPTPGPATSPPTPAPPAASAAPPEPSGPQPLDPRLRPENVVVAAHNLIRKGHYWDAIERLEPVIPRVEGPLWYQAQVLLAQAYLKNPNWTRRAAQILQQVIEADPGRVEALLLLGEIYSKANLVARARAMYRKVLDVQPDNAHALRQLEAVAADPA